MAIFRTAEITRVIRESTTAVKEALADVLSIGGEDVSIDDSGFTGNLTTGDNNAQDVADKFDAYVPEITEENRFERLAITTAEIRNVRFRVADQAGLPPLASFPRIAGTSFEIDYRQVAGRLIVYEPTTLSADFEINLQDLVGIRTEEIGTDLDGSIFLFANKTDRTGRFTANPAIAEVFPVPGVMLAPNSLAMLTLNSIGANGPSQTYELIVQALGGDPDTETLYGTGAPAATLGVVGDSYVRTTTGEEYKKTGTTTWIRQIDNATQAELDAKVSDAAIDTETTSNNSTTVAPSQQAVGEKIKEVADDVPEPHQSLTSAATIAWDVDDGVVADLTLGHNVTLSMSGGKNGDTAMLRCIQDATGSRTLTLASAIVRGGRDAPTLLTAASARDYLLFTRIGTVWTYLGIIQDE